MSRYRQRKNEAKIDTRKIEGWKVYKPRTDNQKLILKSIDDNAITLIDGPAGSGKSSACVYKAIEYLKSGKIDKIIVSRPMVGAGENLGYLPGGVDEKSTPWLIPLYDEIEKLTSFAEIEVLKNEGILECAPLAFLRGRTFTRSFLIIDEASNCTLDQLKIILTRLGEDSKFTINGDCTVSDLNKRMRGGFKFCLERLARLNGVGIVELDEKDIIRHPLVGKILERLKE